MVHTNDTWSLSKNDVAVAGVLKEVVHLMENVSLMNFEHILHVKCGEL